MFEFIANALPAVGGWIGDTLLPTVAKALPFLNFGQQERAYQDQAVLNKIAMEREDNAIQRRAADLKAAGLSKTLAAGSAAGSQAFHVGSAPQMESPLGPLIENQNLRRAESESNIKKIDEKTAAANAAIRSSDIVTAAANAETAVSMSASAKAKAAYDTYESNLMITNGMLKTDSGIIKTINRTPSLKVWDTVKKIWKDLDSEYINYEKDMKESGKWK